MELRGLGVINVKELFGIASTRSSKRVELVVQLERWDPTREYERLGLDDEFFEILGLRGAAHPHAGRARPQHRDPRRGRGAQSAAAAARPPRRAGARRPARRRAARSGARRPRRPDEDDDDEDAESAE